MHPGRGIFLMRMSFGAGMSFSKSLIFFIDFSRATKQTEWAQIAIKYLEITLRIIFRTIYTT